MILSISHLLKQHNALIDCRRLKVGWIWIVSLLKLLNTAITVKQLSINPATFFRT